MLIDLLGSTLNPSLALLRDIGLLLPNLHCGEQLLLPLLKLLLGPLEEPSQGLRLLLQLLNLSKVKSQAHVLLELDQQVTLLIGDLSDHSPNRHLFADELEKEEEKIKRPK